ncbi:MAG: hypothetical protein B7C24_02560 [Bacteroidetes bacterium 4572_77]|nr:MAG: hypothetical protein B7C24_02560 [Bacteroidetes bacterium 4572_77]
MKALFIGLLFLFSITGIFNDLQGQNTIADSLLIINSLHLSGNKVTIDKILMREITIRPGDTLSIKELQKRLIQSQENLMNTSLFNFVTFSDSATPYPSVLPKYDIYVKVIEQWYIWPLPIFELAERNLNTWWQTKDFSMVNYGMFLDWKNFRGRKEHLKILLQFGYDEKLGFSYYLPYIDKKQTIGLSFGFNQTKNHAISYVTEKNQVHRIKLEDDYAQITYHGFLALGHRPNIYQTHHVEVSYNQMHFADTVLHLNPMFYTGKDELAQYFKLSYYFKNDHRDYKSYPLKGYYYDVLLEKKGFGLFKGTEVNLFEAKANVRKYWKLSRKWFFASGLTARLANKGTHPYFMTTGLGYGRDFVRGYEYYVADGQDYGLIKTDLKFALIPQQISTIKLIPNESFNKIPWAVYLSLFGDFAYTPGKGYNGNTLQNELLIGYGFGLNLVTYYDMVIRMEYSFNKMGESGFFIHFIASI